MLQRSRRVSSPVGRKWISSLTVMSNEHLGRLFGIEYYPELISRLLLFIQEELKEVKKRGGDRREKEEAVKKEYEEKCLKNFELLVQRTMRLLPPKSTLLLLLEAHGWNGERFSDEVEFLDCQALLEGLKVYYYLQVWRIYRFQERRVNAPMALHSPRGAFRDDDNLALSFVPSILYKLLSSPQSEAVAIDSQKDTNVKPPRVLSFTGACLLADISGFTKMSSKFCEKGLSGLDDLHKNTSGFLGQYVQVVYAHGGDVIAFAGDALICTFTDTSMYPKDYQKSYSYMQLCCTAAVDCAMRLVELHTDILTSHVGVTCGDMQFASLGGFKNLWTYILTGTPITTLSSCIDDASSREVAVSSEVFKNLSCVVDNSKLRSESMKSGNVVIKTMEEEAFTSFLQRRSRFKKMCCDHQRVSLMRQFVPKPVLRAIVYGTLDTVSELRQVTTVFLKLDTYCPEKHKNPTSLQNVLYVAQKALHETGGFLRQFIVDDKGCVFIAMWGVPSYTFKNNSARAISFSLAAHKGIASVGHKCSIGVTYGTVFCGNVGSIHRRDFVGIGAKVNLAARLMAKSKGRIFMDLETYGDVKKTFPDIPQSEGMKLKGYDELVYARILMGTESFELKTKGTLTSTYVQAGVTKQVMKLINDVAPCRQTVDDQSTSRPSLISRTVTIPQNFDGSLEPNRYDIIYSSLPSPDTGLPGRRSSGSGSDLLSLARKCTRRCLVIEAQSGGGKSAVALLFSSYSAKCSMPSYVVKLKSEDIAIDHCVARKLLLQMIKIDKHAKEKQKNETLAKLLSLCDWPGRPHVDDRVEALATGLGWREDVLIGGKYESLDFTGPTSAEIAIAVRDVLYFLLGQQPCSVIIEHGHFADPLTWTDLNFLMEKPIALALLVTARIGSNKEDLYGKTNQMSRRNSLKHLETSQRISSSLKTPHQKEKREKKSSRRIRSERRSFEHFFELEEPELENKIAYDRAHYTEAYNHLIANHNTVKMELPQLEVVEIGQLFVVDYHWHEEDIRPELLTKIHMMTQGNTYWCKEVALFIDGKGQEFFMDNPLTAMATVVITKVTEKLTMEQQIILKTASVVGTVFSIEILKLAVPLRMQDAIIGSVMYLADHNFITKLSDEPLLYCFPNAHIKSILHDLSPPSERSNMHVNIAQQIEGVHHHNLEPYYELLCYHYGHAQHCKEKEIFYKLKAARKLLDGNCFDDVLAYLQSVFYVTSNVLDLSQVLTIAQIANARAQVSNAPGSPPKLRKESSALAMMVCGQRSSPSSTPINSPRSMARSSFVKSSNIAECFTRLSEMTKAKIAAIRRV